MKILYFSALFFGIVPPVFSTGQTTDGNDNNTTPSIRLFEVKETGDKLIADFSANRKKNAVITKLFEVEENGKEQLVEPSVIEENSTYEIRPNAYYYWTFRCPSREEWNVCWHYELIPANGGHLHTSSSAYARSYLNKNGNPLPVKLCANNIPGNTTQRIYFKTPAFATGVHDAIAYSGGCTDTQSNETHVTGTAQDKIQLKELISLATYKFKVSPEQTAHPNNHYATPDTNKKMGRIAWEYYRQYKKRLTIIAMSLAWGGRYDTNQEHDCWTDGKEPLFHQYGRQVDIRSYDIAPQQRACFEEIACKYGAQPLFEGQAVGTVQHKDYSGLSASEADALDRAEHYHLNFTQPTDPVQNPPDQKYTPCKPPKTSVCPVPPEVEQDSWDKATTRPAIAVEYTVTLSSAMQAALKKFDPAFVPWQAANFSRILRALYEYKSFAPWRDFLSYQTPSVVIADFNGDKMPDAAMLGHNKTHGRRLVVLSSPKGYLVRQFEEDYSLENHNPSNMENYLEYVEPKKIKAEPAYERPELNLKNDAFIFGGFETWSSIYVFDGTKFVNYALSD